MSPSLEILGKRMYTTYSPNNNYAYSLKVLKDGAYLVAAETYDDSTWEYDFLLLKIEEDLSVCANLTETN